LRNPGSWGYVGTDRIDEDGIRLFGETRGPVVNDAGQMLRFALIARQDSDARDKLRRGEPISIVTSYPRTAVRRLGDTTLESVEYVGGCIEAELMDRPNIDAAFELVQSGDSVQQNELRIIEDDIKNVYLDKVTAPWYDLDALMLANKEEKCEND
jgi:ATP phosphoribosyltransferase